MNEETKEFLSSKSKEKISGNANVHNENVKRRKKLIISDSDGSDFDLLLNGEKTNK
jgi:hypothetical protein